MLTGYTATDTDSRSEKGQFKVCGYGDKTLTLHTKESTKGNDE